MKRSILILTAALLAASYGQATTWFRTYGGSGWDEGRCVQEVDDGYIVTGYQTLSSGKVSLWLLKTDTLGKIVWSKTYGGTNNTEAVGNFVRVTKDSGYIVIGTFWDWNNGTINGWLLKADTNGDTLWSRRHEGKDGYCARQTRGGDYIVTGETIGFPHYLTLFKIASQGDSLWIRNYIHSGWISSGGYYVQETEDKGYIVAGVVGDTFYGQEKYAFWLLKTDSLGDTLWSYTQGGSDWGAGDYGACVQQTRSGDYIACGVVEGSFFLKANPQGDTLWTRKYTFSQAASCIEKIEKDEYAITGDASKLVALASLPNPGISWLLSTDFNGDSLWARIYPSAGGNRHLEETRDKGFIITGGRNGDLFLLKTDSLGLLGIAENPIVDTDNGWNVPHSIGNYIVLHYQGLPQGFNAKVFDVSGRKVDEFKGDGNEGAMTWGINYPPGVYFIQAQDNQNQLKTAKVVLVR